MYQMLPERVGAGRLTVEIHTDSTDGECSLEFAPSMFRPEDVPDLPSLVRVLATELVVSGHVDVPLKTELLRIVGQLGGSECKVEPSVGFATLVSGLKRMVSSDAFFELAVVLNSHPRASRSKVLQDASCRELVRSMLSFAGFQMPATFAALNATTNLARRIEEVDDIVSIQLALFEFLVSTTIRERHEKSRT